ncbi:MAG: hypothetical protein WBC74_05225 [Candidatus Omnitrophota bacterium]
MEKVRYEIDPHNRLIIEEMVRQAHHPSNHPEPSRGAGRRARLHRFRKVLDGKFKVDKNNILTYHVKAPLRRDMNIPHQIKFKGKWSLTKNHDLRLTLDKWGRETFGDKLTLKGDMIDVNKNSILFAVTTRTKEGTQATYILRLGGAWQADEYNRITFRVTREKGKYDILTFDGIWEINKDHQIIYRYEKARLIRKLKKIHTLTLKGYWDIKDKARVSYVIDKNTNSSFNFRTGLGLFRENYIKYEVGIVLSHRPKPVRRIVTLFGRWKIRKKMDLIFEVKYEKGKIRAIVFGAEARLTDKDTVLFRLRNDKGKDISANLKLSRRILKGEGQAFVRALKSKRESAVCAGAAFKW